MCNEYEIIENGKTLKVKANCGYFFYIDVEDKKVIENDKWYVSKDKHGNLSVNNRKGDMLYRLILNPPKGLEIDHIDLDRLNNRKSNLRVCSHRANQCNQPLQKNNTSGVAGVQYYGPRGKFTARIKVCQKDIHLGYYKTFEEAVQARNVAMECMWGEYGRYNDVPKAPKEIREKVINKCRSFAEFSLNKAFLINKTI